MAFDRPTLEALIDRTRVDIQTRLSGVDAYLRRSVEGVLARVIAGTAHGLYGYIQHVASQIIASTATGSYLDSWCRLFGVTRTPATVSTGSCTFTGTTGTSIPLGTSVTVGDYTYSTTSAVVVAGGTATVSVTSDHPGADTQADSGQTATLTSPIAGVDSDGVVASPGLSGGSDVETDAALQRRLLARIATRPKNGAKGDYEAWALDCSGVTRAWQYPDWFGLGTVAVFFVRDNDPSPVPDAAEVAVVQSYINERSSVVAVPTALAPTAVALDPEIILVPDNAANRAAVKAELEDLLLLVAEPSGRLYISQLNEAISRAAGEVDHTLVSPVADVVYAANEFGVLGTITWS
jgi:uncharacterized phage protein gp47/JayE